MKQKNKLQERRETRETHVTWGIIPIVAGLQLVATACPAPTVDDPNNSNTEAGVDIPPIDSGVDGDIWDPNYVECGPWDFDSGEPEPDAPEAGVDIDFDSGTIIDAGTDADGGNDTDAGATIDAGTPESLAHLREGELQNIATALLLPEISLDIAQSAAQIVVEGVVLASNVGVNGASLVTTGTVTQNGSGNTATFSYNAAPADRLVLQLPDGRVELVVRRLDADFSQSSVAALLKNEHHIDADIDTSDDSLDITVVSRLNGRDEEVRITGNSTLIDGSILTSEVVQLGARNTDVDSNSATFQSARTIDGDVSLAHVAGSLDADAHVSVHSEEIFSITSVNSVVESRTRAWQYTIDLAANQNNGAQRALSVTIPTSLVKTALRDGLPTDLDTFWVAQGNIERNLDPAQIADAGVARIPVATMQLRSSSSNNANNNAQGIDVTLRAIESIDGTPNGIREEVVVESYSFTVPN